MRGLLAPLFSRGSARHAPARPVALRRDGIWWRRLPDSAKLAYVIGYLDGTYVTGKVGAVSRDRQERSVAETVLPRIRVDSQKIVAGLDAFYLDAANWQMSLPSALHYTLLWLEDPVNSDLPRLLEKLRAA